MYLRIGGDTHEDHFAGELGGQGRVVQQALHRNPRHRQVRRKEAHAHQPAVFAPVLQHRDRDLAHLNLRADQASAKAREGERFTRRVHAAAQQKRFQRQRPPAHAVVVLVDQNGARHAVLVHQSRDVSQPGARSELRAWIFPNPAAIDQLRGEYQIGRSAKRLGERGVFLRVAVGQDDVHRHRLGFDRRQQTHGAGDRPPDSADSPAIHQRQFVDREHDRFRLRRLRRPVGAKHAVVSVVVDLRPEDIADE